MIVRLKRFGFSRFPHSSGIADNVFWLTAVAERTTMVRKERIFGQLRIAAIIALLVIQSGAIQAQTELGFRAGMLYSKPAIHNSSYGEYHRTEHSSGYSIGGQAKFDIIGRLSLVFEPAWSVKGWKVESRLSDYTWNRLRMQMIDLPVLARYSVGTRHFRYYAALGPELNFWLGGRGSVGLYDHNQGITNTYNYRLNFLDPDFTADVMNLFPAERMQISFALATGIQFEVAENRFLSVEMRYSAGNSFFGSNPGGTIPILGVTENFEARLNSIQVSATYSMRISPKYSSVRK